MTTEAPQTASLEPDCTIPIVSLFAGAGGLDLGFRLQGFFPVIAIDDNQGAVNSYNLNDPRGVAQPGDLARLTDEQIVALVRDASAGLSPRGVIGGPPCQGVSTSNVHGKHRDPRKSLLLRYARIVKALNDEFSLDFFVFENVVGLKSKKHKRYFRKIVKELEEAGFQVFEKELDAKEFNVPQRRRRVFVVGINGNSLPGLEFKFPVGSGLELTVKGAIGQLPEPIFFRRDLEPAKIPHHPNHWAMNPRSPKFTNGVNGNGRSFRKLEWDQPSWTVAYGHREMHVHPNGTRRVSVYEGMLLQGFPKEYKLLGTFSEQVDQVSNAVPPPLASAIAAALKAVLYDRISSIQTELLAWFEKNGRSFPWRETRDPYEVLIAEKLLQQTAVNEKVVAAYQLILERHPTVEHLARASAKDLAPIIFPLGFRYRAKELTSLAKTLVRRRAGIIPNDLDSLLSLPGIGDYSARAILSFAHNHHVPIVDTNIARLLHRIFGFKEVLSENPARSKRLIRLAARLLPYGEARKFNLACLDLCAGICTARRPRCHICPLRKNCLYGQEPDSGYAERAAGASRR